MWFIAFHLRETFIFVDIRTRKIPVSFFIPMSGAYGFQLLDDQGMCVFGCLTLDHQDIRPILGKVLFEIVVGTPQNELRSTNQYPGLICSHLKSRQDPEGVAIQLRFMNQAANTGHSR